MKFFEMKLAFAVVSIFKECTSLVSSSGNGVFEAPLRVFSFTFEDGSPQLIDTQQ